MANPPELDNETAYSGDPYSLVVRLNGWTLGSKTFAAQVRAKAGATGDPIATFTVEAEDGTGEDAGKVVVTLSLTGAQTAALPELVACDLEYEDGSDPVTLLKWKIRVYRDVTR